MNKRLISSLLLANLILVLFMPISLTALPDDDIWWNDNWSFREEIDLPIDTSNEQAIYQPIDIKVNFEETCWAKDEKEHSIRIIFQNSNNVIELESQIYNLIFKEDNIISSCNIVYYIPNIANGEEKYYVYYDDEEKSNPDYEDHVDLVESSYSYEEIPGLKFQSFYYQIVEDGFVVYAINKEGEGLGITASQQIVKVKEKTKTVKPSAGELGISLGFEYCWRIKEDWAKIVSIDRLVSHKIIIDGNLMVKLSIVCESKNKQITSKVVYKYYFSPGEDKRIYAHVRHEVNDNPLPKGDEMEATYATLANSRTRSSTFDDLNFGFLPTYLHFYNEDNYVSEYIIDQYPESDKALKLIGKEDDCDLGNLSWVSVDEGKIGRADALIFESNNLLKSETDEENGLELQVYESYYPRLPGVDGRSSILYIERNEFEGGKNIGQIIPEGYFVEFDVEFFHTKNGGYTKVEEETKIYQKLIKFHSSEEQDFDNGKEETEKYNLTAYVHLVPSFPLGSIFSLLGKNFSYISAELFKDNTFASRASVSRLSLSENINLKLEDLNIFQKIKTIMKNFDWNNSTFFKSTVFTDLEPGRYLIKIFRENSLDNNRQFIGYSIFEVNNDMKVNIFCKSEGKVSISFLNQKKNGIENVKASLKKGDIILTEGESNSEGKLILKAPSGLFRESYLLNITYNGFLINEEEIKLGFINNYIPLVKNIDFNVYDFNVSIKDPSGKNPDFNVDFSLESNEMIKPIVLKPIKLNNGTFSFKNLYPANYDLNIIYNNYIIKEKIKIPDEDSISFNLYDFKLKIKDNWNLSPGTPLDVTLRSTDFEKNVIFTAQKSSIGNYKFRNLYPGNYLLKINYKLFELEKQFNIPYDDTSIIFPAAFNVTIIVVDSHGNTIEGAEVYLNRSGEKTKIITNDSGIVNFLVPPGKYYCKIFYQDELIAKRYFNVLNDKKNTVVCFTDPTYPYIITAIAIFLIVASSIFCFKRKKLKFFIKILAISFLLIAIVSSWYSINGITHDQEIETSSNLYLIPPTMTKTIDNDDIESGELIPIEKDAFKKKVNFLFITIEATFVSVLDALPKVILIGLAFVVINIVFKHYSKKKLSYLSLIIAILILLGSFLVFYYAMSIFSDTIVGSFIGEGDLDVLIPGEEKYITVSTSWGPSLGFYLLICSIIILTLIPSYKFINIFINKIRGNK